MDDRWRSRGTGAPDRRAWSATCMTGRVGGARCGPQPASRCSLSGRIRVGRPTLFLGTNSSAERRTTIGDVHKTFPEATTGTICYRHFYEVPEEASPPGAASAGGRGARTPEDLHVGTVDTRLATCAARRELPDLARRPSRVFVRVSNWMLSIWSPSHAARRRARPGDGDSVTLRAPTLAGSLVRVWGRGSRGASIEGHISRISDR